MNEWMNQSINQSTNWMINQSINHYLLFPNIQKPAVFLSDSPHTLKMSLLPLLNVSTFEHTRQYHNYMWWMFTTHNYVDGTYQCIRKSKATITEIMIIRLLSSGMGGGGGICSSKMEVITSIHHMIIQKPYSKYLSLSEPNIWYVNCLPSWQE